MNIKKIAIVFIIIIVLAIALSAAGYFYIQKQVLVPMDINGREKMFTVESGESVSGIADNLEKERLVKNALYFKFYLWQNKGADKIKAGKYLLSSKMAIPEIVDFFVKGNVAPEGVWITIPEGLNNKEIDEKFAEAGLIKPGEIINYKLKKINNTNSGGKDLIDSLLKAATNNSPAYEFLKDAPQEANLEGFLFPDTYRFKEGATIDEIVLKILDNFDKKLDKDLRSAVNTQAHPFKDNKPLNIFEIITLASIVQKEVQTPGDMKIAAGIFYNRLNSGMMLEADSTLSFITDSHRDRASYDDLKIDSPYNTYKNKGLPPGPISNPGLDAIEAAIYPANTDYFYFLTASDGKVIYSKTYDEHLKNVAKWLK